MDIYMTVDSHLAQYRPREDRAIHPAQVDTLALFRGLLGLAAEIDIPENPEGEPEESNAIGPVKHRRTFRIPQERIIPTVEAERVRRFEELAAECINFPIINEEMYYSFQIPKASGGYRQITAPNDNLKRLQRRIADTFSDVLRVLPHDAAHAYTRKRDTVSALKKHQHNQSNWFLKLDLKDFFPSCTMGFVLDQLMQLYPLALLSRYRMAEILRVCFLHDGLPQGSPASPLLSNLVMVPYDYAITRKLWNFNRHHFVYTRYADDILISSKESFVPQEILNEITQIFQGAPFQINQEKTRYGSKAGRNWNLGIMLNKDNALSLGHKEKKYLKQSIYNFFRDYSIGGEHGVITWTPEDLMVLQGKVAYFAHVEPEYATFVLQRFESEFHIGFRELMKQALNPN